MILYHWRGEPRPLQPAGIQSSSDNLAFSYTDKTLFGGASVTRLYQTTPSDTTESPVNVGYIDK